MRSINHHLARAAQGLGIVAVGLSAAITSGCAGHEARTLNMRTALDAGNPREAIASLNEAMDVKSDRDLPKKLEGDNALLVLDRASIQQSIAAYALSEQDFQASDKAIDMLDLSHNASDSIGKYIYSDSAGRYQAPPYEKLLINTLNMLNYLSTHDVSGALIEARRLTVMQTYFKDSLQEGDNAILGLGSLLSGFAHEKNGDVDAALRDYDDALRFSGQDALVEPVMRLMQSSQVTSPRLVAAAALAGARGGDRPLPDSGGSMPRHDEDAQKPVDSQMADPSAEILFVIGYGRVPHKIPQRIPIGLALTFVANDISPTDRAAALHMEAQGLVTWVNFPTLAPAHGELSTPACKLDGQFLQLDEAVDIATQVRSEWKKIEGKVILSAITRLIARFAVGEGIEAAAGKQSAIGLIGSLATQATLTALDTPDTRSWETLPARVAVARVRVPAGKHSVMLEARGWSRTQEINLPERGWAVVSLMGLR